MRKALATITALLLVFAMASSAIAETTLRLAVFEDADDDNQSIRDMIASFQSENPDLTVELEAYPSDYYKTLENQFIAKQSPDVFIVDVAQLARLILAGRLASLDAYIDASGYPADDLVTPLRQAFTVDGNLYGIPKEYQTVCLFYNADSFEKAGLTPPTTKEELFEAATAFSSEGMAGIALENDISCWYPAFAVPSGAWYPTNDQAPVVNSPEAIEALNIWAELFAKDLAKTPTMLGEASLEDAFGKGLAAMIFETGEICKFLDNNYPNIHYGVVEIPLIAQSGSAFNSAAYAISTDSTEKEAAFKLIEHLTSEECQYAAFPYQSAMPSLQSLQQPFIEMYPKWEAFTTACETAKPFDFGIAHPAVIMAVNKALEHVSQGLDPALALAEAQQEVTDYWFAY